MAHPAEFTFGYKDLGKLSGMALNSVQQHTRRGTLDPSDLRSVLIWLARHGKLNLRRQIVYAALSRELDSKAKPRRKTRRGAKRGGTTASN